MQLVVGSAFRNAAGKQVKRWLTQISSLKEGLYQSYKVRAIAVEGDSTDKTWEQLAIGASNLNLDLTLISCPHGGPVYSSTECPDRMKALSLVGNAILDSVTDKDDYLLYVESDLIWEVGVIQALLKKIGSMDVLAPLTFAGDFFYDVWATRGLDGERFSPYSPYHQELGHGINEVSSVGSCLLMKSEVAKKVRMKDSNALVGWCQEARRLGYRIYIDSNLRVHHPT